MAMQWTTRANVKEIISSVDGRLKNVPHHWYNAESFIECKKRIGTEAQSVEDMSCVHVLSSLPNLAGTLYVTVGPSDMFLFWPNPSEVSHSQSSPLHENKKPLKLQSIETILLRYVATVTNPLLGLPARDSIMNLKIVDEKPIWDVTHARQSYNNCRQVHVFGIHGLSRRTCVLADGMEERVIKDYRRHSKQSDNRCDILEKTKGVPGVVEVEISRDGKLDGDKHLETPIIYSGAEPVIKDQLENSLRPGRVQHHCILLPVGEPLEKRESVQEFFEAVHDACSFGGEYETMTVWNSSLTDV